MRRVALLAVALVAAGCGSTQAGSGRATVWVTRDRGAQVLHVGKVPAGVSAMQAVTRLGKVGTRFGGRYLRSVDGVAEHGRQAWFYYVNGYLADRASTDYRLRAGDVLWWDFRSWRDPAQDPVVVGAFPEPFLQGYAGKTRPGVVVAHDLAAGRKVARSLHARLGKVGTKFGGRYLRSVDGVSEQGRRAWFYYVNGYLADRASTDYRLRAGDVLWWDFRSWRDPAQDPVVVGVFPEPFLQGYAGKTRPGVVVTRDLAAGRKVARSIHARLVSAPPPGANVLFLESGPLRFRASGSTSPGAPVRLRFTGNWRLLLRRPFPFRFRYSVP